MGQTGKWVVLIHELAQLAGSEELLERSNDWTNVDQSHRSDRINILGGHTFANNTFHTSQTGAQLVLNKFANGTHTTVTKVVNVVSFNEYLARWGF